ncbi:MAG: outer membrane beta-barrel protein [Myxococcales bacterium]|nr:outer membrane beta-barrel protein [Myxococcales bacterium]
MDLVIAVFAALAPLDAPASVPSADDDESAAPPERLPGAGTATRGDVTASVASDATLPGGEQVFKPWEVGGFIDINWAWNHNHPDNHVYRGTAVQPRTGEITPNLAVLYVRRDAHPGRWGPTFELALQAGPAADALMAYEPTPGGAASKYAGAEVWKHLARANVGLKSRRGTEVSAGLHLSPVGIGVHWSPYNWNYTVTWQLNSVPYYLTGLKVVHPLSDKHGVQAWVVNGWQTLADVNKAPAFMLGYTYTPSPAFAFAEYAYFGPDNADTRLAAWRMFSDSQFTYNHERFGVGGLFDVGGERRSDLAGRPWHMWMNAALFTRWRVLASKPSASTWRRRSWDMAARPEWFWDRDGRMFGVPQHLLAFTFTSDVRLLGALLLRVEYRYDRSTAAQGFFYRGGAITDDAAGLGRDQHTLFFAVAGVLAHRFGR